MIQELKRDFYLKKLEVHYKNGLIKILAGVKGCGKSTILHQFINQMRERNPNDNIIDLDLGDLNNLHLHDFIKLGKYLEQLIKHDVDNIIMIKDIQECVGFERSIYSIHSRYKNIVDIYLTGPTSSVLGSELSTSLTGRFATIYVYPFSYREYIDLCKLNQLRYSFTEYLDIGGFPKQYSYLENVRKENLTYLTNFIITRYIIPKFKIRSESIINTLLSYYLDKIGESLSYYEVADTLTSRGNRISSITIGNYSDYLVRSFLLFKAYRYDLVKKQRLKTLYKYYAVDHSLIYAINGKSESNFVNILENIIYVELLRRGYKVYLGKYYDLEIDFIATKNERTSYIQVESNFENEETLATKMRPLTLIRSGFEKLIIAYSDTHPYLRDEIKIVSVFDWLLKYDVN